MLLTLTDAAAAKIGEFIQEDGNPELFLRLSVKGGGCSGFQYVFTLDDKIDEEFDQVFIKEPIKYVVDALSLTYLQGATIDFTESVEGAEFVVINPNAKTTCGCGSSFSTD